MLPVFLLSHPLQRNNGLIGLLAICGWYGSDILGTGVLICNVV